MRNDKTPTEMKLSLVWNGQEFAEDENWRERKIIKLNEVQSFKYHGVSVDNTVWSMFSRELQIRLYTWLIRPIVL